MLSVQAIFFDIGDTLVFDDPPLRERLATALREVGLEPDTTRWPGAFQVGEAYAVARYVQGISWEDPDTLEEAILRITTTLGLPLPDVPELLARFAAVPFARYVHPDALALLRELKACGFTLGAISDWEATLPDLLAELGIAPYFDALAVSDIVGVTKPHRRLFEAALHHLNVPAENALHVGDWYELDVAGARAAGMETLLFDWPGRRPDADCLRVTTFDEMAAYLTGSPQD